MRIIVTGAAGFIGFHVAKRLVERGDEVVGVDNLNAYYDVRLKHARLELLTEHPAFQFQHADIADAEAISVVFSQTKPDAVINLAAQAGVRYSIQDPDTYIRSNIVGFTNILEASRHSGVEHLVYASSSSVYGANTKTPFSVEDSVDHPVSLYAASKKSNELMAHSYSHLFQLPTTGLRLFTVYGPWGRPDMAAFKFTKAILEGRPIDVFNYGEMHRDFTYIDDIVEGIVRVADRPPKLDQSWSSTSPTVGTSAAPYRIYNIGNSQPIRLLDFVDTLGTCLGIKPEVNLLPMQPGDVVTTYADVSALQRDVGFAPATSIEDGLSRFVHWYKAFYNV